MDTCAVERQDEEINIATRAAPGSNKYCKATKI